MLCAGLGKTWLDAGKKVSYLKLLRSGDSAAADGDIVFIKQVLGLNEPAEVLGTVLDQQDLAGSIKQAYSRVSADRDLVIIEGFRLDESSVVIQNLAARVVVIHDYSVPLNISLPAYQKLGQSCLGVILNKVPRGKVVRYQAASIQQLTQAGLNLLGVIAEDRLLMTLSIGELAAAVQGKLNNSEDKSGELIENFMLGASTFDRGPVYYNRKANKAVILWGERPGVRKAALAGYQIAALGSSTKCIILTANAAPAANVIEQAVAKAVPIISAPGDVKSLIDAVNAFMAKLKFGQEKKMPRLVGILQQNLNLNQI
jgi:BioD-like phosphotransacetylase family protein